MAGLQCHGSPSTRAMCLLLQAQPQRGSQSTPSPSQLQTGSLPATPGQQSGHRITDLLSEPLVSHWKGEAHHPASLDTSCERCGERCRLKVRRYKEHQPGDTKTSFNLSKSHIELHKEFPGEP